MIADLFDTYPPVGVPYPASDELLRLRSIGHDDVDWSTLIADEVRASFPPARLAPARFKTFRRGIDQVECPCSIVEPTIEEIEAVADPAERALAIIELGIVGATERERALILSVEDHLPFFWVLTFLIAQTRASSSRKVLPALGGAHA